MEALPRPILIFSQLFGYLSLKYTVTKKRNIRIDFSFGFFLWGLTLVTFQNVVSYVAVTLDYLGKQEGHPIRMFNSTSVLTVTLDVIAVNTTSVVIFVSSVRNRKNIIEVSKLLQRVDKGLQGNLCKSRVKCRVISIGILMTVVEALTAVYFNSSVQTFLYVPAMTTYHSQAALFLQFTHVCHCFAQRFQIIKDKIAKEVKNQSLAHMVMDGFQQSLPKVEITTGDPLSISKLETLTDLYWLLCAAVNNANTYYCSQLFMITLSLMIHVTIHFYYFIVTATIGSPSLAQAVTLGTWVILQICCLVTMARSSASVANSAKAAAPMVCKLINQKLNSQVIEHLETFLLKLLHQNINFSALGLFQFGNEILISMASSVTTYLVILVQFQTYANK